MQRRSPRGPRRFAAGHIEYVDILREGYQVMDATAISLCMENDLPIIVFDLWRREHPPRRDGGARRFAGPRRDEMTSTSLKDADHKMDQALAHLREDLSSVRTGRASAAVSARVTVEYYGTPFR